MLISHLLRTKGTHVVTLPPDATVSTLLDVLADEGIGAVVVADDGVHPQGIVSERDVVRWLRVNGPALLHEPVERIMTGEVVTCRPESNVEDLMRTMTARRIRHVPVLDDGRLVGIVSIGDVVKHRIVELEGELDDLVGYIGSR